MWLKHKMPILRVMILFALAIALVICAAAFAGAAESQSPAVMKVAQPSQSVELVINLGSSYLMKCDQLTKVAVGDPAVADVYPVSTRELLVNGKAVGGTNLYVWDKSNVSGLRAFKVKVVSSQADLAALAFKINSDIGGSGIMARPVGDCIMLEGTTGDQFVAQRAEAVASSYCKNVKNLVQVVAPAVDNAAIEDSIEQALTGTGLKIRALPDGTVVVEGTVATQVEMERVAAIIGSWGKGARIINLAQMAPVPTRQIMIRSRVLEINRTKARNLGVDWGTIEFSAPDENGFSEFTPQDQPYVIGEGIGPHSLLGGGPIQRLSAIGARVNLLLQNNAARVLSEPNLMVVDGNTASLLVGGEIPIPIIQSSGGSSSGSAVTVQWKEFGVRLNIQPKIGADNTIQMNVAPEVSNLDFANAITFSGFVIPALTSRKSQTTVQVVDGQSLMIGGLYNSEDRRNVKAIPLLSQIPIIGEFFKTTSKQRLDTELVIMVTPEIVEPGSQPSAQAAVSALEQKTIK